MLWVTQYCSALKEAPALARLAVSRELPCVPLAETITRLQGQLMAAACSSERQRRRSLCLRLPVKQLQSPL